MAPGCCVHNRWMKPRSICRARLFASWAPTESLLTKLLSSLPLSNSKGSVQFSSVAQYVQLFMTPWTAALQASLFITNSRSLLKTHVHWVSDAIQPSHPLLSLSPAFNLSQHQGIFNKLVLHIRWPKYWSFSISPSNEYSWLISFRMDWLDLLAVQRNYQESSPTPQLKSFNSSVFSFLYSPTLTSIYAYWKNHSFD